MDVSTYNTSYTVTYTATNAVGSASHTVRGTSGLKALTANATAAFGTCPGKGAYCGGNSHMEPTPNFVANNGAPLVVAGTHLMASCWTTGGENAGTVAPYNQFTNVWVHLTNSPGPGYMSILWFPDPNAVTAGLPQC